MSSRSLETVLAEYRESLDPESPGVLEIDRFRRFLVGHAGLRKIESPGRGARLLEGARDLRCFHFSQYLDWFLAEREGVPGSEVESARAALARFNEWLLEKRLVGEEAFEENRESILGAEEGAPPSGEEEAAGEDLSAGLAEERDFHVPGEYAATLAGEFLLTRVEEGILYGRRDGDAAETGPILVDRALSSGSRAGDRVHLSLGRAGDHWNVLGIGRRQQ